MNINDMTFTVWTVSTRYSEGGKVYAQAAFPTKELADAYVRYSKMVNTVLPAVEYIVSEFQFYNLNFEETHYQNIQRTLPLERG